MTRPAGEPRVGLFMQDFAGGGAERMMLNIARGITRLGIAVDLVVVRDTGPLRDAVPPAARVVSLGGGRVVGSVGKLRSYLSREKPSALLATLVHVNVAAALAHWTAGVSTRLVLREAGFPSISSRRETRRLSRVAYRLLPWAYRRADAIVVGSEAVRRDVVGVWVKDGSKVVVVRNPSLADPDCNPDGELPSHPWATDANVPVLLGVGRLEHQKGFDALIRAFSLLHERTPCRLVILGEGSERGTLQTLISSLGLNDSVELVGFEPRPYAWMRRAVVLVLSSRWEGTPNVVVEAVHCGCRVVVTDCPGGAPEIAQLSGVGYTVPVDDASAMADAMLSALTERGRVTDRAFIDQFTVEASGRRYAELMLPSIGTHGVRAAT